MINSADGIRTHHVVLIACAILATTEFPFLMHTMKATPGMEQAGVEGHPADQSSYLMWMNQARQGRFWVSNLFQADSDAFAPNPVWAAIGGIARAAGAIETDRDRSVSIETASVYHIARLSLSLAYLVALFFLVQLFLAEKAQQLFAWLLIALGGGLGWVPWGQLSPLGTLASADAYTPELWSYPSMLIHAHFPAALLLVVALVICTLRSYRGPRSSAVWGGLALGLLTLVHTYTAVTMFVVLFASGVVSAIRAARELRRRISETTALTLLVALPAMLFQASQVLVHPVLKEWALANVMSSPPLLHTAFGLGLPGLFAMLSLLNLRLFRSANSKSADQVGGEDAQATKMLLVCWVVGALAVAHSGLRFERRCIEGMHIALVLLATPALFAVTAHVARSAGQEHILRLALLGFSCLSLPAHVWRIAAANGGSRPQGFSEYESGVSRIVGRGEVVLGDGLSGLWLPSAGLTRVWAGHPQLTPDYGARMALVEQFFSDSVAPETRRALFTQTGCQWVSANGVAAKAVRSDAKWNEVFTVGSWALFKLRD